MDDPSATPVVAGLVLAAAVATMALIEYFRRRQPAGLRAKLIALIIGLAGAELAMFPALLAAMFSGALDSRVDGWAGWLLIAGYAGLALYVIARLFPWREINQMTADPDAKLADVLRRLRDGDS